MTEHGHAFHIERMPLAYIVWDIEFRVTEWNPEAGRIFGWSADEALGMHARELFTPPGAQTCVDGLWRDVLTGKTASCSVSENFRKDGGRLICEWYTTALDGPARESAGCISMVQDITERRSAEKALQDNEKLLDTIISTEPECVKLLAADGSLETMNRAGLEMIEAESLAQVKGKSLYPLVMPEYREAFMALTESVFQGNAGRLVFEMIGLKGRRLWLDTHAVPFRDDKGDIVALLGITRDITDRVRAEQALRESEDHVRQFFQETSDAIVLFRIRTLTIIDANPAALQLFGISREELAGLKVEDFIPPQVFQDFFGKVRLDDQSREFILEKASCYRKDGSRVVVSILGKILHLKNEYIIFCSIRDMTEKVRLLGEIQATQAKLIHTNKMTSLGMLVSSMAHEINNPNQYISVNAVMLADVWRDAAAILRQYHAENGDFTLGGLKFSEMEELAPRLFAGISEGATRISTIIKDMRDFVREDKSGLRGLVYINKLVNSATSMLWHHIHKHTSNLNVELQDDLSPVRGNAQQIEQVIINLIMNALQSLPDKSCSVSVLTRRDEESGDVIVIVQDQGTGMGSDVLERLREPFFSTKIETGGTGLGLYISDSIIKEHNGAMEFVSEPGKGTTATIRLPAAEGFPWETALAGTGTAGQTPP